MEHEKQMRKLAWTRSVIHFMLHFSGLYPVTKTMWKGAIAIFISGLATVILLVGPLSWAINCFQNSNSKAALSGIILALAALSVSTKWLWFLNYRKNLVILKQLLNDREKEQLADPEYKSMYLNSMVKLTMICRVTFVFGVVYGVGRYTITLKSMISDYFTNNSSINYKLLLPVKYPWYIEPGSKIWGIHLIFETIIFSSFTCIGFGMDSFYSYMCAQVVSQLRILSYQGENLSYVNDCQVSIKKYVHRYQEFKQCCKILNNVYEAFVLSMAVVTSIILCSTAFQITETTSISSGFIWQLFYATYKGLQVFTYTWGGENIHEESRNVLFATYKSNWIEAKNREVQFLVKMHLYQQPVIMNAFGILIINQKLLTSILNTAVSYYFLLRTMVEKS